MLLNILYFLIIFVGIVMVHEFGHFIFAKLFGVYVTEFSVGFGPKLFSLKGKETEYIFKPILLGGYVRMAGDDPATKEVKGIPKERLLYSKAAWKRFLIVFAGPFFSIIAGYVLMIAVSLTWGFPETHVDWVVPNSPAAVAGIKAGDRLISINGHVILDPTEVSWFVKGQEDLSVVYRRGTKSFKTSFATKEVGPQYFMVLNGKIKKGDRIVKVEDHKFNDNLVKGAVIELSSGATATVLNYQKISRTKEMGIYISMFSSKIAAVDPTTGLKSGDVILSIDGMKCDSSFDFQNALFVAQVAKNNGTFVVTNESKVVSAQSFYSNGEVTMRIKRDGKISDLTLTRQHFDAFLNSVTAYPAYGNWYPGSLEAITYGVIRTNRIFTKMLLFLGGLFKTKNALNQFVGPIGLVKMVGQASSEGMQILLTLIAFITLNLGIINLLPLPALDGGHLVFAVIEMITGKRVNPEIEGYIHTIGFFILMAFFVYIAYIDIMRFGG